MKLTKEDDYESVRDDIIAQLFNVPYQYGITLTMEDTHALTPVFEMIARYIVEAGYRYEETGDNAIRQDLALIGMIEEWLKQYLYGCTSVDYNRIANRMLEILYIMVKKEDNEYHN